MEENKSEKESTWIDLRKVSSTVVVAVTAGAFALLGTTLTAWQTLELERRKYEYSLISEILSEETFNQETSSERLQFLVEIGIIKSINTRALKDRAKQEELPSLPVPVSENSGNIAYVNTPPGYSANTRWGPGEEFGIHSQLHRGTRVTLSGVHRQGWAQLIDGTWITADVLSRAPMSANNVALIKAPEGAAVNIRQGPGMEYPIVGQFVNGTAISITDTSQNGWVQLTNGTWVSEANIDSSPQDMSDSTDPNITSGDNSTN